MTLLSVSIIFGVFAGILLSIEIGHRIGVRRWANVPQGARSIPSTIEASIFGLMGLLIAFVFYGAGSRFENRRSLIVEEANAIGTAYLRLDLLPPQAQPDLREAFRAYLRSRLTVYQQIPDAEAVKAALARSSELQNQVWKKTMEALKDSGPAEKSLIVAALNQMIDITTVRTVALTTHPPAAVFAMLSLTIIVSSALVGYFMSACSVGRDWISIAAFAIVVAGAVYVIFDYEFPRIGLIRIDSVDQVLAQTLGNMK